MDDGFDFILTFTDSLILGRSVQSVDICNDFACVVRLLKFFSVSQMMVSRTV